LKYKCHLESYINICQTGLKVKWPLKMNYEGASKSFRTESIAKFTFTFGTAQWEGTQMVMAPKLTRLTHKIAI